MLEKWDPEKHLSNAKPWQLHKVRQQGASRLSESTFLPVIHSNTGSKQNQKGKANIPESFGFSWSKTCFHSSMTPVQGNCCGLQSEWSIWWYLASIWQVPGGEVSDSYSDTPTYERAIPHRPPQLNRALSDGLKKEVKRSVYNTEISDVFTDLTKTHILLFFLELVF